MVPKERSYSTRLNIILTYYWSSGRDSFSLILVYDWIVVFRVLTLLSWSMIRVLPSWKNIYFWFHVFSINHDSETLWNSQEDTFAIVSPFPHRGFMLILWHQRNVRKQLMQELIINNNNIKNIPTFCVLLAIAIFYEWILPNLPST